MQPDITDICFSDPYPVSISDQAGPAVGGLNHLGASFKQAFEVSPLVSQ